VIEDEIGKMFSKQISMKEIDQYLQFNSMTFNHNAQLFGNQNQPFAESEESYGEQVIEEFM